MSLIQRENSVAIKKAAVWGTAVQPAGSEGVYVKSHTPPKGGRKVVTNEDEFGRGMATSSEVLEYEAQSGSMSMRLYSEGMEEILASLMGEYKHDDPSKTHTFRLSTAVSPIFHTVAWDEGDEVKAVSTARIVSGTFNYADGLNLDLNYMGDKVSVTGWSPLDVSYKSDAATSSVFKLSNATVSVNEQSGGALGSGDVLKPSGVSIAVTRGFEALPVTAGNETIDEPVEKTAPVVEVTLNFPKKETATAAYFNAFNSGDMKKMKIEFAVDANTNLAFNFPKVMIAEAPDFAQDSPIPTTIKFKALLAESNPTGMTEKVPYITLKNAGTAVTGYPAAQ